MNKLTQITIFFSGLLTLASCDTTEDAFSVGDKPNENEVLSLNQSQLSFKPEGESFEIEISSIARWEVSVTNNNSGQFSVSPSSGKGKGSVTVTCKPNATQSNYTAELLVTTTNFEMEPVKVTLSQKNSTFLIDTSPSLESIPEEGGSVTMTAYSSLNWEIAVLPHDADGNVGDISWLTVAPGLSGEGNDGNVPIDYRITWSPNYTVNERVIRLQLRPSTDISLTDLPQPFTLRQDAGTLPQNVRCLVQSINVTDIELSLEYVSRSPIKDCGVKIYKNEAGVEALWNTYRLENNPLTLNGKYNISFNDLPEQSSFRLEPFVENEVGSVSGDSQEIITGIKPENMIYQGVSILNSDNGGISVSTGQNSAYISFTVISDVLPLAPDCIENVTLTIGGKSMTGKAVKTYDGSWNYEFNVEDLLPNQEYQYTIDVKGRELPRSQGRVINNSVTFTSKFKTLGLTPEYEDNVKPNVGE